MKTSEIFKSKKSFIKWLKEEGLDFIDTGSIKTVKENGRDVFYYGTKIKRNKPRKNKHQK